jgi:HK97 family phage major capsid protein
MRIDEILARLAAINTESETATGEALAALEAEARSLTEELNGLRGEAQRRQQLRASIAAGLGNGTVIERGSEGNGAAAPTFTLESEEYRSAFLKNLRGEDLTEVEQRAFTFLTTNTTAPLPTVMQNRIIDLIGEEHPIVADVDTLHSGTSITIPVSTTIAADAGETAEGEDANDLQVTFDNVDLSGDDYTANVELSYKMAQMAIPAFESYLIGKIAERIGAKLAAGIVATIKEKMAAANKIATGINYANICAGFGALKRVSKPIVYGTREAVFNKLVGMVDSNKRPIFQQPITAEAAGHLLGAVIKYEDAMGANELLIGDPKKYLQNVVSPIMIESDRDLKKHKHIISGYTCQEGTLTDDKAFALVSEA